MRNIFIIAKREYLERVRSKAFLFMTVFIPGLMVGVTVLPALIAMRSSGESKHLVVAASDPQTAELIRQQLQKPSEDESDGGLKRNGGMRGSKRYEIDVISDVTEQSRAALNEKVKTKQLDGAIWVTDEALASGKVVYITRNISNLDERVSVNQSITKALRRRQLQKKGLGDADIEAALKPVSMDIEDPLGAKAGDPLVAFVTVLAMVMVLYMSVLLYGINVMRAILEEKTSRIMEVMLSIATSRDMMAGKILGVGAVGLTQIAIWSATTILINSAGLIAFSSTIKQVLNLKLVILFPVFFLLGYVLYSTLFAAIGAMVNTEQEAQQMQFIVLSPMILAIITLMSVLQNPGSVLGLWASLFPLTAPLIMFARIALESVIPWWQIALSIALQVATIYGLLALCGRIYRVGVLMYGKKPTLGEIVKWIKYA